MGALSGYLHCCLRTSLQRLETPLEKLFDAINSYILDLFSKLSCIMASQDVLKYQHIT